MELSDCENKEQPNQEMPQPEEPQIIEVTMPTRVQTGTEVLPGGPFPRTATKCAIVGFAPTTLDMVRAYFNDPAWEIWAINQLYVAIPAIAQYATRWFQFHPRSSYNIALRDHNHHLWLKEWSEKTKRPVYMMQREQDIPTSVEFPRWRLKEHFRSYFTNTISWLIALANLEKFETIAIFGVDMACDDEYMEQRPSVEYYLGCAENSCLHSDFCPNFHKTNVYIPPACDICSFLWEYPYEDGGRFKIKCDQRGEELGNRSKNFAASEEGARGTRIHRIGSLDFLNTIIAETLEPAANFEFTPEKFREYLEQKRAAFRDEMNTATAQEMEAHDARQQLIGAKENMRYIQQSWNQHHRWLATEAKKDSDEKKEEGDGKHIPGSSELCRVNECECQVHQLSNRPLDGSEPQERHCQ